MTHPFTSLVWTLRLAARLIVLVGLLLCVAKVWGVGFNHSPILVYAASEYAQNPFQYPIFLVDVERNLFSRLRTQGIFSGMFPSCSVNAQVAFTSLKGATYLRPANIYVMDIFGKNSLQVTYDLGSNSLPTWSPDGRRLAFVATSPSSLYGDVYVANLLGDRPHLLARQVYPSESPVWSPDGRRLLFASALDGQLDLYTVNLADSSLQRLTDNAAVEQSPVWSPDGQAIAFASVQDGHSAIYRIDSDGRRLQQLTHDDENARFPAWSPDGQSIAFLDDARSRIHLMDADGNSRRVLAEGLPTYRPPEWSPDGTQLVVIWEVYAQVDLYLVRTDGSGYRPLVRTGSSFVSAAWCP
jgi:TolB protein